MAMMTVNEFAAKLTGREYRNEMTKADELLAKDLGFIVIFGASDDVVELRGVIHDEVGAYDGTTFKLTRTTVMSDHHCDCDYCGYKTRPSAQVEAVWCPDDKYSWQYKTDVPHATFEIVEDGEPYCRGLVIDSARLPG